VLLGTGSFARVYHGSWRGMDVAVKVLQHDSSTAAAISNEVDLTMSFRYVRVCVCMLCVCVVCVMCVHVMCVLQVVPSGSQWRYGGGVLMEMNMSMRLPVALAAQAPQHHRRVLLCHMEP
jgi:hypothetical protein